MSTGDSAELKIRLINQAKVFIKSMSTFLGISNEIETDTPSEIQAKLKIFLENQNLGDELTLEDAVSLLEDFNDSFDIKPIAKIIEEIKSSITIPAPIVNVEAPIVNYEAPIVNVEAPNVTVDTAPVAKEIIKVTALLDTILLALKRDEKQIDKVLIVDEKGNPIDLLKALKADQPMFGGRGGLNTQESNAILNMGATYAKRMDGVSTTNVTYYGVANKGSATANPVWRIMKIDESQSPEDLIITWADGNDLFDNIWDNRLTLNYL
jgi:hypothetical protein